MSFRLGSGNCAELTPFALPGIITHLDTEDIDENWQQPGKVEDAVALVKDWDPTSESLPSAELAKLTLSSLQSSTPWLSPPPASTGKLSTVNPSPPGSPSPARSASSATRRTLTSLPARKERARRPRTELALPFASSWLGRGM